MKITAAHLRAARGLLGMTQNELAELAGVSPKTIYNFEAGEHEPSEDTLLRIVEALRTRHVIFYNGGSPGVRLAPSRVLAGSIPETDGD